IGDILDDSHDGAHLGASVEERTVVERLHGGSGEGHRGVAVSWGCWRPDPRTDPGVEVGRVTPRHALQDGPVSVLNSVHNCSPALGWRPALACAATCGV